MTEWKEEISYFYILEITKLNQLVFFTAVVTKNAFRGKESEKCFLNPAKHTMPNTSS